MISVQQQQQRQQQQPEVELEEANTQIHGHANPEPRKTMPSPAATSQVSPQPNSPSLQHHQQQQQQHLQQHHHHNQSPPSSPQSSRNSSFGSASGQKMLNSSSNNNNHSTSNTSLNNNSITSLVPGGVVTTQNISTVIKPKSNSNSLQFVKIQTPELSKKAVEQIRITEESNRSREKIKEVEEEWQNNLLNWKSKRRQQFVHTVEREPGNPFESDNSGGRKIKTFAEMMEQRAKSGNTLGFHLQRYIGSSGDDDDDYSQHRGQSYPKNELDGDTNDSLEENNSSNANNNNGISGAANSQNQNDDQQQQPLSPTRRLDEPSSIRYDPRDDGSFVEQSSRRDNNISLVDSANHNQLSSTFRDDVSMTTPQVRPREPSFLSKSEQRAQSDDESCSDEDDLDDEEHEEQRILQRVAFEAKLKAFEKLTKPTVHAPALRPSPPPKQQQLQQQKPPPPSRPTRISRVESVPKDPRRQNVFQLDTSLHDNDIVPTPAFSSTHSQKIPTPPTAPIQHQQSATSNLKADAMSQSSSNSSVATSSPELKSDGSIGESMTFQQADQLANRVTNVDLNRPSGPTVITNPTLVTQPQQQSGANSSYLGPSIYNSNGNAPAKTPLDINTNSGVKPPSMIPPIKSNRFNKNYEPPRPQLTPPTKTEDKEKAPPLQVSGKKRCSSCKEELGRGAAAFVVESLSLVYHTNCFRCSVCHVNLSNGFRGVDVRVHAGALHCQNCYSKDGLNYSRV